MKKYFLIVVTICLSSCYAMVPVNIVQKNGGVDFYIDKEGLIFKTNREITFAEVYETRSEKQNTRKVVWSIASKKFVEQASTFHSPTPGNIRYGVVPEGYVEEVEATPLQEGTEYDFWVRGPGYGGGGNFVYSH